MLINIVMLLALQPEPVSTVAQQQCLRFVNTREVDRRGVINTCGECKIAVIQYSYGALNRPKEIKSVQVSGQSQTQIDMTGIIAAELIDERPCSNRAIPLPGSNLPSCNEQSARDNVPECIDVGTTVQCDDCGGGTMHACPSRYAMTGIGYGNNQFKCTLVGKYNGYYIAKGETARYDSISCKTNHFMVGLHATSNRLACAKVGTRGVVTYFQEGISRNQQITTCPNPGANAGIQVMTGYHEKNKTMICANLRP
jgi:hypothetical protein